MKASFFSLTEAKYAAGDTIKHTVFDNVETAQVLLLLLQVAGGAAWL